MSDLDRHLDAVRGTSAFCAYNANVDAIVSVDADLEETLDRPHDRSVDRVSSSSDLASAITRTMAEGEGNEIPLTESFGDWLAANVDPDERRVGGQAGIMADVLSVVGAAPILYTYLLSPAQRSMFRRPESIRFPVVDDSGALAFRPVAETTNAERTKRNWVFQFEEGTELFGTPAASTTRFIAASRPQAFDLETGALADRAAELGREVDCALLSGHHSLKLAYDDGSTYADHIESGRRFLEAMSAETTVQVEYGVCHDQELRDAIRTEIAPRADVISVDAREFEFLARDLGIDPGDDVAGRCAALRSIREALGVSAVKLHAREYLLAVVDDYLPPERVREGLQFAAVVAASKARHGTLTDASQLEDGLAVSPSIDGRNAIRAVAGDADVVAVPNRVYTGHATTVGIGDAVACTSFVLEQALDGDEPASDA
jgi:ADP-dependent phosphofructokinase/glucokinase